MKAMRRAWQRLRGAIRGGQGESDLGAELESHIEMQIEDNLRAGMTLDDARRDARLKLGSLDSIKESYRDQRGLPRIEALVSDIRWAIRGLRKTPGFTIVAVATLALGIGANTAVFSLVDQILLHPRGIANPDRIVAIQTRYGKLHKEFPISSARVLVDLQESTNVFDRSALMSREDFNYTGGESPQRLRAAVVTFEWFDVFGAKPMVGRVFDKSEDQPGANHVVVLSHGAWTRLFGPDVSVLGRSIELNQTPYRIVGVMPPDFLWPHDVDFWIPQGLRPEVLALNQRFGTERFLAVAHLLPGVSFEAGSSWIRLLADRVRSGGGQAAAVVDNYQWSLAAIPFVNLVAGETRTPLLVLLGAVAFVLLIACSNIAGLLLARASTRAREFAVRAALGAGQRQLLRSVFAESLVIALLGGVAGLALASFTMVVLIALAPESANAGLQTQLNTNVLLFCAAASLTSALLFGVAPAWQISRIGPSGVLKTDGNASTSGPRRQRARSILVVAETALALILLIAGGLFLRSFVKLQRVNPGFDSTGVMTAAFWLPERSYATTEKVNAFFQTVLDRLQTSPGVTAAAIATAPPFSGLFDSGVFMIEGKPTPQGEPLPFGYFQSVTPGYFRTLGIPLKSGRLFSDEDRLSSEKVVVIDESLARQYWPGEDPIGKTMRRAEKYRVIGVVGHVTFNDLSRSDAGVFYFDLFQVPNSLATILVKSPTGVSTLPAAIREAVRTADPYQSVHTFRSMDDSVANSLAPRQFGMRLVGFFAGTALLLAALGLYGVISYSVAQRTREIGIRVALGADQSGLVRLVVSQGVKMAALGVGLGLLGSVAASRLIQTQLFEVSAFDPLTIGVTAIVLLGASALASYLPARRATHVDPMEALRPE